MPLYAISCFKGHQLLFLDIMTTSAFIPVHTQQASDSTPYKGPEARRLDRYPSMSVSIESLQ
jgi:hypothetical protein